jgi:hypothetical protein
MLMVERGGKIGWSGSSTLHCSLHVGCSTMPGFGDDKGREFSISSAEWHDASYHNAARRLHHRLQDEARASGFDVHQVETSIATPKTCRVEGYLAHVGQSIGNFQRLYAHYKQERGSRWKTYRREQKALHKFCMRFKRNPRAKREHVVVACGAAQFGPSMKGLPGAPVKRFCEHLKRYVLVVPVDEYQTSQVCSKCLERWLKEGGSDGGKKDSEEEQADSGVVLEALEEDEGGGGGDPERAEEEAIRKR